MACPLFLPASPLAPRTDLHDGACAAEPGTTISEDVLRTCCNRGYARGKCARAAQAEADAFRFLIKASRDGVIDVAWSSERNHHPVAVGVLQLSGPPDTTESGPLECQARAYAAAYFHRTGG